MVLVNWPWRMDLSMVIVLKNQQPASKPAAMTNTLDEIIPLHESL